MTNLFDQIRVEVETNPDGWTKVVKAQTLAALVVATRPLLIVEIGVWSGRSLIPMAMSLKHIEQGIIVGIDPWDMRASIQGMTGEHLKWWSEVDHEMMFQRFTARLLRSDASHHVEIHRCRSDEFKHDRLHNVDILSIDGNHGEESSCYDVTHFAPKVRIGGFLFMDDPDWAKKANEALKDYGFEQLYPMEDGIMYQRVK